MKILLDQKKCVSGGQCVFAAPEVFDQREDDGVAILLMETIPPEFHAAARQAADLCPVRAITVVE